jgi:3-hydroxyisobutyrate dehydrogenase-like beta-hydroxyacid dehydrogenase
VKRIGFIGLGIMGAPMAANLAGAGFEVAAWNRTRARAIDLEREHGARAAATPADAADGADAVITMVTDSPQVEAVLFGDDGAAEAMSASALAIDMSTVAPSATKAIAERLERETGAAFLEAPVSGSRPKAEAGTLTIMAGGSRDDFERARPVLDAMGELVVHVGPRGHGSMAKLLSNTMGAVNVAALAQALLAVRAAGIDADAFRKVTGASAGASAMLELKAGPMLERAYDPLFKLQDMLKDVRNCRAEAEALGLRLTVADEPERLLALAADAGHGESDFAAIFEVAADSPKKNP